MQEATKEQMNKMTSSLVKSASEMNSIMHDAVSATLQSTTVIVNGYSDLCDTLTDLTQRTIEQSASVCQTWFESGSVNDLLNKQGCMMKTNFDNMISEVNNITQLSSKIAQDAAAPMTNHVNQTMNKMAKSANAMTSLKQTQAA